MIRTYNITEIAALLHKKVSTIYNNLCSAPHLVPPPLEIPGNLLWHEADVEEWLEKRRPKKKGRPRDTIRQN